MAQATDFILMQATPGKGDTPDLVQASRELARTSPLPMTLYRLAWSTELRIIYGYAQLATRSRVDAAALPAWTDWFLRALPQAQDVRASRLECVFDRAGHSHSAQPLFHYVVEMDPDAGWMPEIARWYDQEHMPGLANVPGCVRAMRMLNHDHGPLSLACYDLVSPQTLGSPPWLAVRATAWSDITRPHFTNTKRTMFEIAA